MKNERWEWCSVDSLFEISAGKTMSPVARNGKSKTPFLRTSNVLWDQIDLTELDAMEIPAAELEQKSLLPGDLLVCEGGEIGRAAIWSGQLKEVSFQNHIHRLRPIVPEVDPRFYVYFFQAAFTQLGLFEGVGNVTTIPNLSRNRLGDLLVPRPKLDEQRAIAHTLAAAHAAVAKYKASIDAAQELRKAAIQELFTRGLRSASPRQSNIGLVPEDWQNEQLGKIAHIAYGAQAAVAAALDPALGTLILTNVNISIEGNINLEKKRYYRVPEHQRDRLILQRGDVLFNWRSGSQEHVGKTAYFDLDGEYTYSSFILRFRPHSSVSGEFLFRYLTYLRSVGYFSAHKNVSSINSVFNASLAGTIPIWFPQPNEQQEIVDILGAIDKKLDLHKQKKAVLEELFQTLLHNLMTGQVKTEDLDLSALELGRAAEGSA